MSEYEAKVVKKNPEANIVKRLKLLKEKKSNEAGTCYCINSSISGKICGKNIDAKFFVELYYICSEGNCSYLPFKLLRQKKTATVEIHIRAVVEYALNKASLHA